MSGEQPFRDDLSSDGIADMGGLGPRIDGFHWVLSRLFYDVGECVNDE